MSDAIRPQKPQSQKPQKPKSAAQRASEANTIQQRAVFTNTPRPGDRRSAQPASDTPPAADDPQRKA